MNTSAWKIHYSPASHKTAIVTEDGYTVIGPLIADIRVARKICEEHNRAMDQMADQSLGLLTDVRALQAKQADADFYAEKDLKMKMEGR